MSLIPESSIGIKTVTAVGRAFPYLRYIRLQERLRRRRRECLLFCEHPPTLTAGVKSRPENLLLGEQALKEQGVSLHQIGRGGDFTAHEPGQIVIYPHLDLQKRGVKIGRYFNVLLEISHRCIQKVWDLDTIINEDAPGLYMPSSGAKILSIGVMFKGFFTSYGVALNVSNDLKTFGYINPCGDSSLSVTSIVREWGAPQKAAEYREMWSTEFREWLGGPPG